MVQKLDVLPESPSQTAGPYVHIGCTPNFCGIEGIYPEDLGGRPFPDAAERIDDRGPGDRRHRDAAARLHGRDLAGGAGRQFRAGGLRADPGRSRRAASGGSTR